MRNLQMWGEDHCGVAEMARPAPVPGEDGPGVVDGAEFLRSVRRGERPYLGSRVAVIGGGGCALDCARAARRMGSEPIIFYRGTRDHMPGAGIAREADEAMAEGIELIFLAAPQAFHHRDGRLVGMHLTRMELDGPDEIGRRRPVPISDGGFAVEVDTVLTTTGEAEPAVDIEPPAAAVAAAVRVSLHSMDRRALV